jgi:transcriptional regulator with XRE-family HTH domain
MKEVVYMTFYELFVMALEEKGMTASDICAKAGIHPSYISKLKSGWTKDVTWEKAMAIIDALGMTPDEFRALGE